MLLENSTKDKSAFSEETICKKNRHENIARWENEYARVREIIRANGFEITEFLEPGCASHHEVSEVV